MTILKLATFNSYIKVEATPERLNSDGSIGLWIYKWWTTTLTSWNDSMNLSQGVIFIVELSGWLLDGRQFA